jgi:rhodanese-related sulfurtransferase
MAKAIQLSSIIILILVLFIYLCFTYYSKPIYNKSLQISVAEAKSRRFGLIIDVRTPKERELLGYYPNSIPISSERLKQEVLLDISSKDTWILVYSNGDNRASTTADILYKMGYKNVRYIKETYLSLMPGSS